MYTIYIWNTESPNFLENEFVDCFGTETIVVKNKKSAMNIFSKMAHSSNISRVVVTSKYNTLEWKRGIQHPYGNVCNVDLDVNDEDFGS